MSIPGLVHILHPTCSHFRPRPEKSFPGYDGLGGRKEILGPTTNSFRGSGSLSEVALNSALSCSIWEMGIINSLLKA